MNEGKVEKRIPMPVRCKERLLGGSRCMSRLLRLGVRTAVAIDETGAVLCLGNKLYEINIDSCTISDGWNCGRGIRPLSMTIVKNINGFQDGIYFGGYLGNKEKNPVHIYHRIGQDQWEIVYTFPERTINHVHCIVTDPYRQCLWVFTGDFDEAAAIWKVTNNFKKMECVVCNNQQFRGCVAYAVHEGLLYATDAPNADNFIYLLNPETIKIQPIFPLHGSCIYGCQWNDNYVFSSTVEGDGQTPDRLRLFFNGDRGDGIKDNYVHLYLGNHNKGFREIYKEEKDCWSFLFQFGVFKFPYGYNNTDTLYFQPMATKRNDLSLMAYKEKTSS